MAYPGYGGPPGQAPPGQYGAVPGAPPPGGGFPGQAPPPQQQGYPGQQGPPQGYRGQVPTQQPGYPSGQPPPPQQGYGGQAPPQGYGGQPPPPQGGYPGQFPPQGQAPPQAYNAAPYGQQPGYGAPPQQPGAGPGGMPPGMSADVFSWFVAVDQDNTGKIDAKELQQALTNANWTTFDEATCKYMIGMFDQDKSGTIDVTEFGKLWDYIQQWKRVFEGYDRDRSGGIDANELNTALNQMGYRVSPSFSQLVVHKYDTVHHKQLRLDSYIQVCALLNSLTDAFRKRDTQMTGTININYEDFLTVIIASRP